MRTIAEVQGEARFVELEAHPSNDRLGRGMLRRIQVSTFVELAMRSPASAGRMREVPRAAVVDDGHDDDGFFALLACPCGHRPVARYVIEKCSGCERYYVACAPTVFVLYGEMELPHANS